MRGRLLSFGFLFLRFWHSGLGYLRYGCIFDCTIILATIRLRQRWLLGRRSVICVMTGFLHSLHTKLMRFHRREHTSCSKATLTNHLHPSNGRRLLIHIRIAEMRLGPLQQLPVKLNVHKLVVRTHHARNRRALERGKLVIPKQILVLLAANLDVVVLRIALVGTRRRRLAVSQE